MKLTYTKISKEITKYFYQDGDKYGEFYIRIGKDHTATLEMKDPDYGLDLIQALAKELMPTGKVSKKQFMLEQTMHGANIN